MSPLEKVQEVMRRIFMSPDLVIASEMTARDVDGWDSLSHTVLMLEIETALGIEIDMDEVARCRTVGMLVDYVSALVAARTGNPPA